MDDFDSYLNEQLKDPAFQEEWRKGEQEYQRLIKANGTRDTLSEDVSAESTSISSK